MLSIARPRSLSTAEIHVGQKWPIRLKEALAHSRCLVGIWSPLYFQSEWCRAECAIMLHRESQLGFGKITNSDGLVVGIKVNDGDHFPQYARHIQYADFESYFVDGPGFTTTALHVEFQKAIVPLSTQIARIVSIAPVWCAEWLTPQWTDDIVATLPPASRLIVRQPVLN